jgi:methionyl-tRNA formyltransferase
MRGQPQDLSSLRIVFLGTPEFAVPSLKALLGAGHLVALVVTRPPREAGRGRRQTQPPVARIALQIGLPLYQPERVRATEVAERIADAQPDLLLVVAYGQILPPAVLAIPRLGCLNVHASLLPRHRGASPISAALLGGDTETGVSVMLMDEGMDTGPVLARRSTSVAPVDDEITLTERLAAMGAELLTETLPRWARGEIQPEAQDQARVTLTRPTTRSDGTLDWTQPAVELCRRVRAFAAWPQGLTWWKGQLLHICSAGYDEAAMGVPGIVQAWGPRQRAPVAAAVGTGAGVLLPVVVGLQGRRPTPIDAFLRGHPGFIGSTLQTVGGLNRDR